MNSVNIIGRQVRPADLRTTGTGKSVASFSIAVNGFRKDDPASFFNVVAWAQTGDYVANYGGKGRLVAVSGRLSQRKYTTSDGQQREVVEIIAENVSFVDSKRDDAPATDSAGDEYDPFAEDGN